MEFRKPEAARAGESGDLTSGGVIALTVVEKCGDEGVRGAEVGSEGVVEEFRKAFRGVSGEDESEAVGGGCWDGEASVDSGGGKRGAFFWGETRSEGGGFEGGGREDLGGLKLLPRAVKGVVGAGWEVASACGAQEGE